MSKTQTDLSKMTHAEVAQEFVSACMLFSMLLVLDFDKLATFQKQTTCARINRLMEKIKGNPDAVFNREQMAYACTILPSLRSFLKFLQDHEMDCQSVAG